MTLLKDGITIPVVADTANFSNALKDLETQSEKFGRAFTSTISSAVIQGKSFEDTLRSLALRISNMALQSGLKPLENLVGSAVQNVVGSLAQVGASQFSATPFAKGGVVNAPTLFGSSGGAGLMGEAGAEAILPLARGSDGRLGVRSDGGAAPVNITFNISTPDVAGFKKSQGQISGLLARTVQRGRRTL